MIKEIAAGIARKKESYRTPRIKPTPKAVGELEPLCSVAATDTTPYFCYLGWTGPIKCKGYRNEPHGYGGYGGKQPDLNDPGIYEVGNHDSVWVLTDSSIGRNSSSSYFIDQYGNEVYEWGSGDGVGNDDAPWSRHFTPYDGIDD